MASIFDYLNDPRMMDPAWADIPYTEWGPTTPGQGTAAPTTPAAPSAGTQAAQTYAANPFVQTAPKYTAPQGIGLRRDTMAFGFGDLVKQLQNGGTLPGMSGAFPNQYQPQSQQQVSPYAFIGMQGNPFAGAFQNIATSGLPMMQGLGGLLNQQGGMPQAMPQAAPQQAQAAPQAQAMPTPMQAPPMAQQGGYGRQRNMQQGGMGRRGMSDAVRAFFGMNPGFGGGNDQATGQYVAPSQLGWDQHMLKNYMNRSQPGSFFYGGNPQAGAHWLNTVRRRQAGDPLRQAMFGGG